MTEQWRPIPGWTYYAVSSEGRVYSWKTRKYIKTEPLRKGGIHFGVSLKEQRRHETCSVAKVMLIAFRGIRVMHLDSLIPLFQDGNGANVRLDNLSYKIVRRPGEISFESQQWHQGATNSYA